MTRIALLAECDAAFLPRPATTAAHAFFIGTLFVPQLRSSPERPHPLVTAFLRAAVRYA